MKKYALLIVMLSLVMVFTAACTQTLKNPDTTGGNPVQTSGNTPSSPPNTGGTPPTDTGSTPPTTTGTVKELRIEAYNFGFKVLNTVQINKGDTVKLTVTSADGIHGFAMPDFNVNLSPIAAGESKTVTFIADKSGTFTYFCNVPCGSGHREMNGQLKIL